MASSSITRTFAIVSKDFRSEVRTRYGISALLLFVVITVTLVVFAAADEVIPTPIVSALIWIVMCFTGMTGLGRGFISEEERGTLLFLRINSTPLAVYAGKLIINVALSIVVNLLGVALLFVFVNKVRVGSWMLMLAIVVTGSASLATTLTVVSALIAKAGTRSALLPVLSFPLLAPVLLLGTKATLFALAGLSFADAGSDLLLVWVYTGLIGVVSTMLFEFVWAD